MPVSRSIPRASRRCAFQVVLILGAPLAHPAFAQTPSTDPLDPKAASAPLSYKSAFEGYRPFRVDPPLTWQSVNETVRGVGGHTGSVREVQLPAPDQPSPASAASSNAPEAPAPKAHPREPVHSEPSAGHQGH